jgi:hypothetical protein
MWIYGIAVRDEIVCLKVMFCLTRPNKLLPRFINFLPHKTVFRMVINQPHRLHKSIHGGWADELPAAFFELF